jgi:hypothetical protein
MFVEQPVLQKLRAYWDAKRVSRPYPSRDDIDPMDLRFILGSLILIDVEPNPLRFRYRLFGSEIARRQGFDMTGKYLDQHPWPELAAMAIETYRQVLSTGQPAHIRRQGMVDGHYVSHISLVLPLGHEQVEILLAGVVFVPITAPEPSAT